MQQIRISLRGRAVVLCGKNTIIRKVIKEAAKDNEKLNSLADLIYFNVALVFTNDNLNDIRKAVTSNKAPAAARVGTLAPDDCFIPPGPTGLDPGQTGFFQALDISTKIVKGAIEIINQVHLIRKGEKITPSQVSLLSKLDIKPFFFGMGVTQVWENGSVYAAGVLDITPEDLLSKFFGGVQRLAAVSLAIGVPNAATIRHSFARAFRNLVALAVTSDGIEFKQALPFKEYLADPAAYAAKHGVATSAEPAKAEKADKKEEAPAKAAEKEESEEDVFGGGGLFGDD